MEYIKLFNYITSNIRKSLKESTGIQSHQAKKLIQIKEVRDFCKVVQNLKTATLNSTLDIPSFIEFNINEGKSMLPKLEKYKTTLSESTMSNIECSELDVAISYVLDNDLMVENAQIYYNNKRKIIENLDKRINSRTTIIHNNEKIKSLTEGLSTSDKEVVTRLLENVSKDSQGVFNNLTKLVENTCIARLNDNISDTDRVKLYELKDVVKTMEYSTEALVELCNIQLKLTS